MAEKIHYPLLDPLRVLASFAVVRTHMRGDWLWGLGSGLFLFMIIMIALAAGGSRPESVMQFTRRKAGYFLSPWARWSVFYLCVAFAAVVLKDAPPPELNLTMLAVGGHPSLWFLPFAVVAVMVAKAANNLANRHPLTTVIPVLCLVGIACTQIAGGYAEDPNIGSPWRAWIKSSPCLPWGLALAQLRRVPDARTRIGILALVTVSSFLAFTYSPFRDFETALARRFAFAVLAACLGFAFRPPMPRAVKFLGTLTFGTYLVHPFVGKVMGHTMDVMALDANVHTGIAWVVSACIVYGLRLVKLRWEECAGPLRPSQAT